MCLSLTVPAHSSLPGANHTIYLDFDGHVTTGTSWNNNYGSTITSPAYNRDGDAANFSATELADIENAWKRVAEDFAPFHVNVTTVAPPASDLIKSGSTDTRWGVRVVITQDTAMNCGCGGIAYINSFNWNSDTPVFVYTTGGKNVAEAASHEVGHSLGLSHDGTSSASYYSGHGSGATGWAPIMGVGYYREVTQWDKGEYTGANNGGTGANYNKGPDDLAVITSYNGFGYRVDDHGNQSGTASALTLNGTQLSGSGLIERTGDTDWFSFVTETGSVTLNVAPASTGANLDLRAELYDASGGLVAWSDPTTALNASISQTLPGGQYFLKLDGVGVGNPAASPPTGYSDYASLGQYSISGTVVAVHTDLLSVSAVNAMLAEGNSSETEYTFVVTRTGITSGTTTVNYSVSGSGSSPANTADFAGGVLPSGTLQFDPHVTSLPIVVRVAGDTTVESNEDFVVQLSQPSGLTQIVQGTASGSILNDDAPPPPPAVSITATDASKNEGHSGSTPFTFTVTRSGDVSGAASVKYTLAGTGSKAANSGDFQGGFVKNVLVNFAPQQLTAVITIQVKGDTKKEPTETFKVTLSSPVNVALGTSVATGTIVNDDGVSQAKSREEENRDADPEEYPGEEALAVAIADPIWMFVPPEELTADQLRQVVREWTAHGGLDHDDHAGHESEHEEAIADLVRGLQQSLPTTRRPAVAGSPRDEPLRRRSPSAEVHREASRTPPTLRPADLTPPATRTGSRAAKRTDGEPSLDSAHPLAVDAILERAL